MKILYLILLLICLPFGVLKAQLMEHYDFPYGGGERNIQLSPKGELCIAAYSGIYMSSDNGDSWMKICKKYFTTDQMSRVRVGRVGK